MSTDLEKLLNEFGRETVDAIVSDIVRKDVIKTGVLKNSIDYDIFNDGDTIRIQFKMVEYGKYVDEGTRYIEPREFFNKVIERKTNEFSKDLEDEIEKEFYKSLGIK
jgi:hypothetical protein